MSVPTVTLSRLNESHLEATWAWIQDPVLRDQIDLRTVPVRETHFQIWRTRFADRTRADFAILADGLHVGNCGLKDIDPEGRKAELWIYIGAGKERSRGFGAAGVKELLKFGFNELKLEILRLRVLAENESALRFYQKLGFAEKGIADGFVLFTVSRNGFAS